MSRSLKSRPTCDLCQKPVEEFTEEEGDGTLDGFVIFTARCHGRTERQKLRRSLTKGLNFDKAFHVTLELSAPEPKPNPLRDYWDALNDYYRERGFSDDAAYDDFRERTRSGESFSRRFLDDPPSRSR